jgi:hypothetical protein
VGEHRRVPAKVDPATLDATVTVGLGDMPAIRALARCASRGFTHVGSIDLQALLASVKH